MVGMIFNLSSFTSRSRGIWLLPLFFFILLLSTRISSLMTENVYILYFVYYACLGIAILLSLVFMCISLKSLFVSGYNLKSQAIFFKKLGYGMMHQFFMKTVFMAVFTIVIWSLCSFIIWKFNIRFLILMSITYCGLLMLRTAALSFKTSLVYYVAAILIALSFFYPVYILPNPAYLLKGGLKDVLYYSIVYMLLYLTAGYKFFISAWRHECIGWIF